jgi:hypothetical protein
VSSNSNPFLNLRIIHTAHLIGNRHNKKDKTCDKAGETTLTAFKNIENTKTPIAVSRKAQEFTRIATHPMIAEEDETCGAVPNFKRI